MADPCLPQLVDVRPLVPFEANSRTHTPAQIEELKAAFRRFGFVGVIAYLPPTGLKIGHARRQAAMEMWEAGEEAMGPGKRAPLPKWHLPAVDVTGLDDAELRALVIADNKIALNAGWDDDKLRSELAALAELDFDLSALGFNEDELAKLWASPQGSKDPDEIPPPPAAPASVVGDVWLLGRHRLACGDSADGEVAARALGGKPATLTLTDPPYGIGYEYREHDDRDNEANAELVARVFAHAPPAKVWTPGKNNLARDLTRFGEAKMIIWHKGFAAAGSGLGGASTVEPILVVDPPRKKLPNDYLHFGTDREELDGRMLRDFHPCPKPVALYAHLLDAFCPAKGIVYEPFAGSGTTLIACEIRNRRCVALEFDPAYVDVVILRWQALTGKEATLEETGQTFAELQIERLTAARG